LGFEGSGTEELPYKIKDYSIYQDTVDERCIEINNTRSYFEIANCEIGGNHPFAGIYLYNVTNGKITESSITNATVGVYTRSCSSIIIQGNTFGCVVGAYLETSDYNVIEDNIISASSDGMWLDESNNNTISNNTIMDYWQAGIILWGGIVNFNSLNQNNTIENNRIFGGSRGIWFESAANQTVVNNWMYSCGIAMQHGFMQLQIENNYVNDKPSLYYQYEDSLEINQEAGEILLLECYNVSIHDVSLNGSTRGISLLRCANITIEDSSITSMQMDGMDIDTCENITISGCMVHDCLDGVTLWPINNATLTRNDIESPYRALKVSGTGVVASWNTFIGAEDDAIVYVSDNSFNHNFYSQYEGEDSNSDGIGDTPFSLPGGAGVVDLYPLMFSPKILPISAEPEYFLEFGASLELRLNISSDAPITSWELNDEVHFSFNGTILTNSSSLAIGTYPIELTLETIYEIQSSTQFTIIVNDTLPPVLSSSASIFRIESGDPVSITLELNDPSGISGVSVNNTLFDVDGEGVLRNTTLLALGEYPILLTAHDPYEHSSILEILVIVQDTIAPEFLSTPESITISIGETGNNLVWEIYERNPASYVFMVNDVAIYESQWNGGAISVSIDGLSVGTYNYTLIVSDTSGNEVSSQVMIYVIDPTMQIISLSITIGSLAVIIVVVAFLYRRR